MNRRNFILGIGAAIILPYEPKRIYSFASPIIKPIIDVTSMEDMNNAIRVQVNEALGFFVTTSYALAR